MHLDAFTSSHRTIVDLAKNFLILVTRATLTTCFANSFHRSTSNIPANMVRRGLEYLVDEVDRSMAGRQTYFYRPDYEKHKAAIMELGRDNAKVKEYVDKERQKNHLRGNVRLSLFLPRSQLNLLSCSGAGEDRPGNIE